MTNWLLTLTGGPRGGDRIATTDLLPFLVFTTADADGATTDHYYGPTSVDRESLTAEYEPVSGPENALAQVWEDGYRAGVFDGGANTYQQHFNPYGRQA